MRPLNPMCPDVASQIRAARQHRARCRRKPLGLAGVILLIAALTGHVRADSGAPELSDDFRGLPLARFYPLEEIGDVSLGARLNFDPFGRLAVIQNGAFVVLNDSTWLDLSDRQTSDAVMVNVIAGADGQWYYGALGGWGLVEDTPEGKVRARSLVPRERPKWTLTTNFSEVVATKAGIYFGGWGGVVYLDIKSRATTFIAASELSRIFRVGDKVFASCHHHDIQYIDVAAGVARPIAGTDLGGVALDQAVSLDESHALVASFDGRLFTFDGERLTPWLAELDSGPNNRVAALCRLVDGAVAIAINGRGLFLVSPQREILTAMTSPEYYRISALASREPGVLWTASEKGLEKVFYGSPVTVFGQRLGLPVSWPQVVRWRGRLIVASGGRLYEATKGAEGSPSYFEPMAGQPASGTWGVAAMGPHMLIGNSGGVFALRPDGAFVRVSAPMEVARLVMVTPDLCYAIGIREIAVLRWAKGRWAEGAPRVAGFGYPSVVHRAQNSAWMELGPNRAARVTLEGGQLVTRLFENFPWSEPAWINIGVVGDIVVLSGPAGRRIFFDENRGALTEAPDLQRRLEHAPFPIERIQADQRGTLWASHEHGIFTITREQGVDRFDTASFDIIDDHSPIVQLLPDGDVWISSGRLLYHVDRRQGVQLRHSFVPVLVSAVDQRSNRELSHGVESLAALHGITYAHNNLSFRFFAGSYAYRRPPTYEFTLNGRGDWTKLESGSVLNFPDLREGTYRLGVTLTDSRGAIGPPLSFDFTILPPWYRTWYSYALLGGVLLAAFAGLLRWLVHRTQARNVVLEQLVQKRTNELKATMQKLNEETRNAATLAERNRLAGEIHDSVQQGLSGMLLNLDSTLKLPGLTSEVRSRLNVARNMLSFTRHEVQHAVWGMESPLLEGTELGEALKRLTSWITAGPAKMVVKVSGTPTELSSTAKHHLLRMAQEAITNAVRHSAADTITIAVAYEPGVVTLTVADDGRGFDPDDVLTNGIEHFGVRGLRSRASEIGADLEVRSAPGHGTSIHIALPIGSPTLNESHVATRTN